jgi:hypothetical protein
LFSVQKERKPASGAFLPAEYGEGAMKIIGAGLLFLCLASGGMAVTTTLASAHPPLVTASR